MLKNYINSQLSDFKQFTHVIRSGSLAAMLLLTSSLLAQIDSADQVLDAKAIHLQHRIDGLKSTISSMPMDQARADSLFVLTSLLYESPQTAIPFSTEAYAISKRANYAKGQEKALKQLMIAQSNIGHRDSVELMANLYLEQLKSADDSMRIVNGLSFTGRLLNQFEFNDEAFDLLKQAVAISERNKFSELTIFTYSRLANLVVTKDLFSAINYLERALKIAENETMYRHIGVICVNLSILHDSMDQKLIYLDKAIAIGEKTNNINVLSAVYASKGEILNLQEKHHEAISFYIKAKNIIPNKQDNLSKFGSYNHSLGYLYLKVNKPILAQKAFKESTEYFKRDRETWSYTSSLKGLSLAVHEISSSSYGFDSLLVAYDLSEKYYRKNIEDNLQELNKKFDVSEKEKKLAEQQLAIAEEKNKRSRQLLIGLGLASLLTLLGIWLLWNNRKRRQETEYKLKLREVEAESFKELNQMKSRWFENISHDIRTPLTLISAPIKDVLNYTKSKSTQNLLEIADRSSQHLLQLTNEMLELARLENNVIPIHKQGKLALLEINKIIHAFDSYAHERNISIVEKINLDTETILQLDYDKYEKVYNNLFKNAVEYSPAGSSVLANISFLDGNLITTISDEGPGIPKDEIPYLFDKYFRASHQQSKRVEGSGLGLSIVKELVELMKGQIRIESTVGTGTTFIYSTPAERLTQQSTTEASTTYIEDSVTPTIQSDHQSAHLLIVEDNAEMLHYLSSVLSINYTVFTANNALLALQILEKKSFDLIISDIMMPGMDGYTFKKRVNLLTNHHHAAFIFLSAKSLDKDKLTGLQLGVDDYITKPFVTAELHIRIKNLLNRKSIREEESQTEGTTPTIQQSNLDELVNKASEHIKNQLQNPNFGVEPLAQHLHLSSIQLNRKLKQLTGMTTVQFILEVRLQHARQLLISNEVFSVKEVRHQIGIQSQSYFSKKYSERFGSPPSAL